MPYQIAASWNNAAGLTTLSVQPRDAGIQPGLRRRAGNLLMYEDGMESVNWIFDLLFADQYEDLLTELGLASATSAKVTVRTTRNTDRAFANYNAVIERPTNFDYQYWWNKVEFPLLLDAAL
jgi:hypothetical protein